MLLAVAIFAIGVTFSSQHQASNGEHNANTKETQQETTPVTYWQFFGITISLADVIAVCSVVAAGLLVHMAYRQNETSKAELRAQIIVDAGGVNPFQSGNCVAQYIIRNVGRRPATKVQWWIQVEFSSDGKKEKFDVDWEEVEGNLVLAQGAETRRAFDFRADTAQIHNFTANHWLIYVWG
jgi:hypothetical protein